MEKICSNCCSEKDIKQFNKDKKSANSYQSWCRVCIRGYYKTEKGKESIKKSFKKYYNSENGRKSFLKYFRNKYKNNFKFKIDCLILNFVKDSFKNKRFNSKYEKILGYTIKDLISHFENQFNENMSWNNYGKYWCVDHIKPKYLFKYKSVKEKSFKECWALKNLQPLKIEENRKKGKIY